MTLAHEPPTESPRSLQAAYALLADGPWRPVAGGTDLLVQMAAGTGDLPDRVLDLARIDELRGIAVEDGALVLGALTTYTAIRRSAECREHVPALVEAAATIGAAQIQNRGTIGGNIANASPGGGHAAGPARDGRHLRRGRAARRANRRGGRLLDGVSANGACAGRAGAPGSDTALARARGPVPQGRDAAGPGDQQGRDGAGLAGRRGAGGATSGWPSVRLRPRRSGPPRRRPSWRARRPTAPRQIARPRPCPPSSSRSTTSAPRPTTGARLPPGCSTG